MLEILHCIIDDKFINGAIDLYETDNTVKNTYVIVQNKYQRTRPFRYVSDNRIERISESKFLAMVNKYDVVILHSLYSLPFYLITQIDRKVIVCWFAWGWDLYEGFYPVIPINLYGDITRKMLGNPIFRLKDRILERIKQKKYYSKILSRIDYFSGVFPYEYDLLRQYNTSFVGQPLDFYYGSSHFFVPEQPDIKIENKKSNIIIGNSANYTNNHCEALRSLAESNLSLDKETKIILPLSYSNGNKYVNTVIEYAERYFPDRVIALKSFMPLNDYLKLVSNCKIAIFAHERQQASDNIFMQLLFGAKVFMSETSLAFDYLKGLGLHVFSLQSEINELHEELSDQYIMDNRQILSEHYSSSKLIERVGIINNIFRCRCLK